MANEIKEVHFLKNIGLLMTFKCQVACPHCILEAGPHRKEEMSIEDANDWIKQIGLYRDGFIQVLSLTGGEPFFDIYKLGLIVASGDEQDLLVSAVTNAFWAATQESAISILKQLPGLKMLQFSTDVYHQKAIPFERVKNAIAAADTCGIPYTLSVCTENENDPEYQSILRDLEKIADPRAIYTAITFQAGRALKQSSCRYETTLEPPPSSCGAGGAPIIFPDGRVIACIGPIIDLKSQHPLFLGSLRENSLAEILDRAELNVVLHAIRLWGPKKLIQMIRESGIGDRLPKTYVKDSVCHACYDLMANPDINPFFMKLAEDQEFCRKVAYGRVYYLNEPQMVTGLGLAG